MTPLRCVPLALLCAGLAQAATVEVEFVQPEKFADIGTGKDAKEAMDAMARHLKSLGEKGLPAQQLLQIRITDVDLAGAMPQVNPRTDDIRVMGRGADWPRISLSYRLSDGGKVLAEGEDKLSDMSYLDRKSTVRPDDPVPYENRMLTTWFNGKVKAKKKR